MSEKKSIFKPIFFITNFMCLIPIVVGFILWNKLPEAIPQQYGWNDQINWSLPKFWGIITLPLLMCITNIGLHIGIGLSKQKMNDKVKNLTLWIIPIIALPLGIFMLLKPMGLDLDTFIVVAIILSILFIIIGNYLPKTEPNHVIGVRMPWTINNSEVWKKTHRVSGFVLVLVGFFNLIVCFTPIGKIAFLVSIVFAVVFMIVYSIVLAVKYNNK